MSSSSLLEGIEIFFRYQAILGADSMTTEVLEVDGDVATVSLKASAYQADITRYEAELFIGQWVNSVNAINLLGIPLEFTRIDVRYPKPQYTDIYSRFISCPIYYNKTINILYFESRQLSQSATIMLDCDAAQFYQSRCQAVLNSLRLQDGLIGRVRRLIVENPKLCQCPEIISKHLKMSYRSFRRRLSEEGISIKKISDEVRMGLASKYLNETEYSTQEIAFLLGYSETPNFHRAFKRWWQQTPGEYRIDHRRC